MTAAFTIFTGTLVRWFADGSHNKKMESKKAEEN
jgi:hypothetical protein